MNTQTDQQLLREYAETRSEQAFDELVRRHIDFVFSAALRLIRDAHLAQDVTQGVFLALADNARELARHPVLAGWLHRTARNIAAQAVRSNARRSAQEQKAVAMNELVSSESEPAWGHIESHLDIALGDLNEVDRDVILLRYFHGKSAQDIGKTLGLTEEAARKRLSRALDRLRELFAKRGVTVGTTALVAAISTNAIQAAPIGLSAVITTAAALGGSSVGAGALTTITKTIAMITIQKTLIAATFAALAGAGFYEAQQAWRLRDQAQALQEQQAVLTEQLERASSENKSLSSQLAQAGHSPSVSSERLRELLRLRGEVGVLRRQQHELEQTLAAAQSKGPQNAARPSVAPPQPSVPAPFQVQLVADAPGQDTEPMTNSASGANGDTVHVNKTPVLDYTAIRSANVTKNPASGAPEINVELSDEGRELFAAVTKENLNKRLAIVMNGQLYAAPVIRSEITDGKAQITGNFTEEEAQQLAAKINEAIRFQ